MDTENKRKMANRQPGLGMGIYTASDASKILREPFTKTKYWFQYYIKHRLFDKSVGFRYYFEISDIVAIDFLSLITMSAFFEFKKRGISAQQTIRVHENMSKELHTHYPFAQQDLYTAGKSILYKQIGLLIEGDTSQTIFPGFLDDIAKKISFNDKRLAHKFYPLGKDKTIVVNPENQFGLPVIEGTNILTDTIYDMILGGEREAIICKSYGITLNNINDVVEFSEAA